MKKLSVLSTLFASAVLVLLTSLAVCAYSYGKKDVNLYNVDWASKVDGKFVKVDFDLDGDLDVNVPGNSIEKDGVVKVKDNSIIIKQWTDESKTASKDYKFTYKFSGKNLILKPATKADAALIEGSSSQPVTFHMCNG